MKTEMTIDQKLVIIREAIEEGAHIDINFFHIKSRNEGKKIIDRMAEKTGASIKTSDEVNTFSLNHFETPIDCTVFYDLDKEEKKEKLLHAINYVNKGGEAIEQAN